MTARPSTPAPVRMGDFVAAAAQLMHVTTNDVMTGWRRRDVMARAAVAWTIRMGRGATLPKIGDALNGRSARAAALLIRRAIWMREIDIVFRARTDLMFAVFMKTPREG